MRAPIRTAALVVTSLATVTLAAIAWRQHQELLALRAEAVAATAARRAERQAPPPARPVEPAPAEAIAAASSPGTATGDTNAAPTARPQTRRPPGPETFDNPGVQRMMANATRATLDQRYNALFRQLQLDPAQLARLKDLLTERQLAAMDVMRAGMTEGLDLMKNGAELDALLNTAQQDIDANIHALLGDDAFARYQDFNQNIDAYGLLDQLERRLTYSTSPLSSAQTAEVLRLISTTTQSPPTPPGMGNFARSMAAGNPVMSTMLQPVITDSTIAQAQTVLTPAQVEVLTQLKTEQEQQRATFESMRPPGGGGGGPPPPAGP